LPDGALSRLTRYARTVTQIRIEGLTKTYGATHALNEVNFEIRSGELFFLLGPSGCGKTTLLRSIAGLQAPSSGRILFDGRDVTAVPTQKRNAVMCFQGYALWPHMTVRDNIRFGLSVRGGPAEARLAQVEKALDIVRMRDLADRKPQELSGGQQQRVALARALAVQPACLLLDEPLSNLDTHLRQELRKEIRRICREAGITTVYVTHDQKEALSTADRMAVMKDGRLVQVGTPQELYYSPTNAFVAEFMGPTNLVDGEVVASGDGMVHVATAVGDIVAAAGPASGAVTVSIRPELISIFARGDTNRRNHAGAVANPAPPGPGAGALGSTLAGSRGAGGPGSTHAERHGAGAAREETASSATGIRWASGFVAAGQRAGVNRLVGTVVEGTFLGQLSEHLVAVGGGQLSAVSAPPQYGLKGDVAMEFAPRDVVVLRR
jgi:iron(III) transport system ATP-binding protein